MEIVRDFAASTIRDIKRNHGMVFDPLKTTLAGLVAANRPLEFIVERDNLDFMNLVSRLTQIAIFPDPKQFYVPDSNNLTLEDQRKLLEVDEAEVVKKKWGIGGWGIGGMELIIGDVATGVGLVFAYFDKTNGKVRLHGEDYSYRYGRTETPTPTFDSHVANVGYFYKSRRHDENRGLRIDDWSRDLGGAHVWVVRLGVPAQE